jgi:S-adenosylmethionine:tRNA ribosyltransferase-isomerase
MPDLLNKASYAYELPKHLIAQYPLADRPASRLMVLDKKTGSIAHRHFYNLTDYLKAGDVLVVNDTKVIPARLFARKENGVTSYASPPVKSEFDTTSTSGSKIEVFILHKTAENTWKCLVHPGKRIKQAQRLFFSDELRGYISLSDSEGLRDITFEYQGDFWEVLHRHGHIPLPPYIERSDETPDQDSYQTVYARDHGSVAAPTAGLHFDGKLIKELTERGVIITSVLLHVGLGTFRPVKTDNILHHKMHSEYCEITPESAQIINQAKQQGRRIIAVGTTSTRTLESFAEPPAAAYPDDPYRITAGNRWTDIFIYPGKPFRIIDGLITNFHLPESTLMMLVSALAGWENIRQAYREAVSQEYRFFSYGDAMLIL